MTSVPAFAVGETLKTVDLYTMFFLRPMTSVPAFAVGETLKTVDLYTMQILRNAVVRKKKKKTSC